MNASQKKLNALINSRSFRISYWIRNILHYIFLKKTKKPMSPQEIYNEYVKEPEINPTAHQPKSFIRKNQGNDIGIITYFICHPASHGWILHGMADRIRKEMKLPSRVLFTGKFSNFRNEHSFRALFFMHFSLLLKYIRANGYSGEKIYVWFTHMDGSKFDPEVPLVDALNVCSMIFVPNGRMMQSLIALGVHSTRIMVVLGGFDPERFTGHTRGNSPVCIVGGYYERKSPELLMDVFKNLPDENFHIIGPVEQANKSILWSSSPFARIISELKNVKLIECDWNENHKYIKECDVYLSLANNEGGPIPLLECMAENLYPIVSETGFANDLIINNMDNGMIISCGSSIDIIAHAIRHARKCQTNIRGTVFAYTWTRYSSIIAGIVDK